MLEVLEQRRDAAVVRRQREVQRLRSRGASSAATLGARYLLGVGPKGLDGLRDDRRSPSSFWSTRPRTEHDRVDRERRPRASRAPSPNTISSTWPSRSSSVANIMSVPERVRILRACVTIPPIVTLALSARAGDRRQRAVDGERERLAHRLQRMRRDEQADRLLLDREQLVLVELDGRDRRPARRRGRRRGAADVAEVEDRAPGRSARPAAPSGRRPAPARARRACRGASRPVEPSAPHLISASIAFLLTARASTRSQKSHSERERTALLARALDRLDGLVADALDRVQAEADVAARRP